MSFMKGDYVTCPVEPPDTCLKGPGWVPEMTTLLGETGIIVCLDIDDTILVEYPTTGTSYWYRTHWLVPSSLASTPSIGMSNCTGIASQQIQGGIKHSNDSNPGTILGGSEPPEPEAPRKWRMRDFRC